MVREEYLTVLLLLVDLHGSSPFSILVNKAEFVRVDLTRLAVIIATAFLALTLTRNHDSGLNAACLRVVRIDRLRECKVSDRALVQLDVEEG